MSPTFWKRLTHVAVWVAFLSLPVLIQYSTGERPMALLNRQSFTPPRPPYWLFATLNLVLLGFYLLNYYVLLPRLLTRGRRWGYFLSVFAAFVTLQMVFTVLRGLWGRSDLEMAGRLNPGYIAATLFFSLVWAASSGIRLSADNRSLEERRQQSETARLKAELGQLKSQLNPHFLFNTLNGIYTLTLSKSDHAPDAVLKLSHLLRYVMAEANADFVPLDRDLEHLRHFIALHQMRLTSKTPVHFEVSGQPGRHQIAPLLFLPFVENAFKYGSSTRGLSPIHISLKINEKGIDFYCQNHIQTLNPTSTGIGLDNTRRRLDLLYPNRYQLDIRNDGHTYEVHLQLQTNA